ncbi:MAG: preprotein translocase subunit SecE [Thermosulfidibacteraceae bacterium]|jgi:preprotein translocase subunit SecE
MDKIKGLIEFFKSTKDELKRISFPTRKEVIVATIGVISFSIFVSIYLGVLDFLFSKLISIILAL